MTLEKATQIARTGQYIRCNVFGEVMQIVGYLTNGLGIIYRKNCDGTISRYVF